MQQTRRESYTFQKRAQELFHANKNALIQAPTGAGKTYAALVPPLWGFAHDVEHKTSLFPPRIIYTVPMRTLARGFYEHYLKIARNSEKRWQSEWEPRIQTGEQPDDPVFEGKLIFATIDQVLASFLNVPYGLPGKLDNINAGALIGSYLVFDEIHLYPRQQMLLTTFAMLKMLEGVCRFTMMSATLSRPFLGAICQLLGAELIAENEVGQPSRFDDVESVRTQKRTWYAHDDVLNAEMVIRLRGERTLCICNTVDRAQDLYTELKTRLPNVEIILLHSRFYLNDRRAIEDRILALDSVDTTNSRTYFERSKNIILIATQVVEVGLDISADVLLTECAPASSLIQRAGRCARRKGESGDIHVFQPVDAEGQVNYAPYIEDKFEDVCHRTWAALTDLTFNGQILRFGDEQRLVDLAHGAHDAEFLDGLQSKVTTRIDKICEAIRKRDPGAPTHLIRESTTFPLYVTANDDPNHDENLTENPRNLQAFSLSRGALYHFYEQLSAANAELPFYLAGSDGSSDTTTDDDGQTRSHYLWTKLRTEAEVYQSRWFAAHQRAISYHPQIGLRLHLSDTDPAPASPENLIRPFERISYAAERYHEHIQGLAWAYKRPYTTQKIAFTPLRDEVRFPLRQMCARLGLDAEQAEQYLMLMLALHDVGKLNRSWQSWAGDWQTHRANKHYPSTLIATDIPLAHTDYDGKSPAERELQSKFNAHRAPRGTHAVESAEAVFPLLRVIFGSDKFWIAVITSAIMHHHTPDASTCGTFAMIDHAEDALRAAFAACDFKMQADGWQTQIQRSFKKSSTTLQHCANYVLPTRDNWTVALMYFLFVRVLRLADQRSGHYWKHYQNIL